MGYNLKKNPQTYLLGNKMNLKRGVGGGNDQNAQYKSLNTEQKKKSCTYTQNLQSLEFCIANIQQIQHF